MVNNCLTRKIGTHFIGRLSILDFKQFHSPYHTLHSHKNVLVYQLNKSTLVLIRVPCSMNNTHLFNKSWLAGFSSTYKIANRTCNCVKIRPCHIFVWQLSQWQLDYSLAIVCTQSRFWVALVIGNLGIRLFCGEKLTEKQKLEFSTRISLITPELFLNFLVYPLLFPDFIRLATLHGHALGIGAPRSTLASTPEFLYQTD